MDRHHFQKHFNTIIYLILAAILTVSCALPAGVPVPVLKTEPTPTDSVQDIDNKEPLPPVLAEISPLDGSQLGAAEPITFYFSQPMDRNAVEAALYGLPPGSHSWSDNSTLTYTPEGSFEADTDITVAILSSAADANGLTFVEPVTLTYSTSPTLRAINFLPQPASQDIDPKAAIAVTFNQPVAPLGLDTNLPEAFSLEPPVNGHGEWLSTSTYIFYPGPALAGGVAYTASLNTDLVSTTGAPLDIVDSSIAWSFKTALPRLVSVEPSNEQTLSLSPTFKLTFNQAMDPASFEGGFAFLGGGAPVSGEVTWNDDHTEMTFEPIDLLERSAAYTLTVTPQATAASGTPLALEQQYQYFTYGGFSVQGSDPAQGGVKSAGTGGMQVFFTAPPNNDDLKEFVSLSPELGNKGVFLNGTTLNITGFYVPEREYTLTISPELTDRWGQPLGQPVEIEFRTAVAKPNLNIPYWGTTYFVRPDEPALQANATNIQRADVLVAPLTLADFQLLTGPESYDAMQTYFPSNPATYSQTYRLTSNRSETISLPLAGTDQGLGTGFYFVNVTSPQLDQEGNSQNRNYLVGASHVNLTFKIGATDALLWATDLRTNEPVSAPFAIYDNEGAEIISAQTDARGLWRGEFAPQEKPGQTYTAIISEPGQDNFGVAQSSWSTGVAPWDYGITLRPRAPEPKAYLYSDRPIYRPGQTVYFRGVVRQAFNGRYELPELESIQLNVRDNDGRVIHTLDLPLSPYGTFHGEYQLSAEARPGHYSFDNSEMEAYLSFSVAEYRKPEIELEVAFAKEQVGAGEQVRVESEANYYFGSPAGDLDVNWNLYERPTYFNLPGYRTGVIDDDWLAPSWARGGNFGRTLDNGTTRTEADGSLLLTFDDIPAPDVPQTLTLEMTVQDESGFPLSARDEMLVHPADFYIGLRPDQWVGQSGADIGFDVFTANWNAEASPSKALAAEFKQVRWDRKDPAPEDTYGFPTYQPVYTLVGSSNLATSADGKARLSFTPEEPGTYMLDVYGGEARTQILLWITGEQYAPWPSLLNDQVTLTADQEEYLPDQTANIFIPNPFDGPAQALVTVERGKVLHAEVLTLGVSGSTYSLNLTDEHAPNVYVSATLLGSNNQFRQGYVTLEVAPSAQELQVELTAQPEINEPRGEMTLQVRVTDSGGAPVQGEFSLAVVDKAVLALADPNSEDILPAFYGKQSLGIATGLSLANYSGRYLLLPGGMGGGGGEGVTFLREEFPDTAYWNPTFVTDANGTGQVTITLPDNLTTWFIETRGLTLDTRVGQAKTEVVTTKPLLIRPITPRFLVTGDHVELAAIVHNNTDAGVQATVNLNATGFTLEGANLASQTVDVPANGRARVTWWGTADDADEAKLAFTVSGESDGRTLSDAATPALGPLPIRKYVAPQTFLTSGMLTDGSTRREVISLPRTFSPTGGRLDVEMSPSLAASILSSLEALPTPSCTCNNEAVLSYLLPNLETYLALQASGMDDPILKARLDESLNESVGVLVSNQNYDGGWGWISGSDSDTYISAYVLFGLGRARTAGISIPDDTFERAHAYFQEFVLDITSLDAFQPWKLDRLAFTLFALTHTSGLQDTDVPVLSMLFDKRDQLSPWAQALLALGIEFVSPSDPRTRDLLANLEATAIRTGSSSNWESDIISWRNPGTSLYTTAVVAYALAQRDPAALVLIEAVRYLSSNRNAESLWGSTYENAWVIMALTEAMKGFGELQADFTFSATLNGTPLANGDVSGTEIFTPVSSSVPLENLLPSSPNDLTIERESGLGRLYYRASLLLNRPVETAQPLNRGMEISRAYYDGNCESDCSPLSALELAPPSGTMPTAQLTARLTLTLPNDSYYVVLEDHIPAGTEILDQTLKTSQQGEGATDVQVVYDVDDPFARGWGWWYFDEPQIRDEGITWTADYLPAGTYELTYTLTPTQAGSFRVLPAHAWLAFFPDVQGTSAGTIFEITP